MNNWQINEYLHSNKNANALIRNPAVHESKKHSFLPHICGSIFFENIHFESMLESLDVHVITLRNSDKIDNFLCKYNLDYVPKIFEGIDSRGRDFNHNIYKETQGIPPIKGQEKHLGCTLSHFYLWRKLKKSPSYLHLILEDDVFFTCYANKALAYLVANLPEDADVIFVNGRSAEKLYAGCEYIQGSFSDTPTKMLLSRKEMISLMIKNFDSLRLNPRNNEPVLFLGTDGYILTKSGVEKLNDYVKKIGMAGMAGGASNNVDTILTAITTDISDHDKRKMAGNFKKCIKKGSIAEKSLIKAYVCSFPLVDVSDRLKRR